MSADLPALPVTNRGGYVPAPSGCTPEGHFVAVTDAHSLAQFDLACNCGMLVVNAARLSVEHPRLPIPAPVDHVIEADYTVEVRDTGDFR